MTKPGVYGGGVSKKTAQIKLKQDILRFCEWSGKEIPADMTIKIIKEIKSVLHIHDADSELIFDNERFVMTQEAYEREKQLVLRSAEDFHALYRSIPHKLFTDLKP